MPKLSIFPLIALTMVLAACSTTNPSSPVSEESSFGEHKTMTMSYTTQQSMIDGNRERNDVFCQQHWLSQSESTMVNTTGSQYHIIVTSETTGESVAVVQDGKKTTELLIKSMPKDLTNTTGGWTTKQENIAELSGIYKIIRQRSSQEGSEETVAIYCGSDLVLQKNLKKTTPPAIPVQTDQKSNGQDYNNIPFTYKCPSNWSLGKNLNYNGQVELSECAKVYSGKFSFDDGVRVLFGFVPQSVANNYEWAGENRSKTLINEVKSEPNSQQYANNNFVGRISMKNKKHALKLIARYQFSGGYYELSAEAVGDRKTDQEFKKMIDDIVSTFSIK